MVDISHPQITAPTNSQTTSFTSLHLPSPPLTPPPPKRELDRAKAQKKLAGKGEKKEGDKLQRNAADKDALAQKIARKAEQKAAAEEAEAASMANGVVTKPKKKKKDTAAGLDDLLSAGLAGVGSKGKKGKK